MSSSVSSTGAESDGLGCSPEQLLTRLDELLASSPPLDVYSAHGTDYSTQLDGIRKIAAAHREEVKTRVAERACQLLESRSSNNSGFRIFSIGCGDGTFDIKILEELCKRFPNVKIHYIGTDIDKTSCQQARELLGALKNVEIKILVEDFQLMDSTKIAEIPPCDLVLAVHISYYIRDIKKALSDARMLQKPDGHTIIVSTHSDRSPKSHIYKRFWLHERKWPMSFAESVIDVLNVQGNKFQVEMIECLEDFTECLKNKFKKPAHLSILRFISHTNIECYPPAVAQTCIDYLTSVAKGNPMSILSVELLPLFCMGMTFIYRIINVDTNNYFVIIMRELLDYISFTLIAKSMSR